MSCNCDEKCEFHHVASQYVGRDEFERLYEQKIDAENYVMQTCDKIKENGLFATKDLAAKTVIDYCHQDKLTCHLINDLDMDIDAIQSLDPDKVKVALENYSASLNQNVDHILCLDYKEIVLMVTNKPIKAGEQLSRRYGLPYWYKEILDRWINYLDSLLKKEEQESESKRIKILEMVKKWKQLDSQHSGIFGKWSDQLFGVFCF
jgi:hypothetical protein